MSDQTVQIKIQNPLYYGTEGVLITNDDAPQILVGRVHMTCKSTRVDPTCQGHTSL